MPVDLQDGAERARRRKSISDLLEGISLDSEHFANMLAALESRDVEAATRIALGGSQRTDSNTIMPDDLTDAKIAASEARAETKFARLEGKIDTLFTTLQQSMASIEKSIDTQRTEAKTARDQQRAEAGSLRTTMIVTAIASVLAIAGLLIGMMSYGASTFYNGTVMRDAVKAEVAEHAAATPVPEQPKAH